MIKKSLLFCLLFISLSLSAQIEKAAIFLGGNASSTFFSGNGDIDRFGISFQPKIGFFIDDQILIGGQLISSYSIAGQGNDVISLGIGPFARYYFSNGAYPNYWFVGIETTIATIFGGAVTDNTTNVILFPQAGFNHFFNSSVALEVKAGPALTLASGGFNQFLLIADAGLQIFIDSELFANRKDAQPLFESGSIYLGASNLAITFSPDDGGRTFASLSPNIGFFLSPRFSLGARAGFSYLQDRFTDFRVTTFDLAPFLRYYMTTGRQAFFLEANGGIRGRTINTPLFPGLTETGGQYQFGVGLNLFLTDHAAFEGFLSYQDDSFQNITRLAFDIGFQYFLN